MSSITAAAKKPVRDQDEIINTYLSDKNSYAAWRVILSLTDKKVQAYVVPQLVKRTLVMAAAGGIAGGAAGYVGGGPVLAVKGASAGAAAFGTAAIVYTVCRIPRSNVFQNWLGEAVKSEVFPMFVDFIQNDNEMADLMCIFIQDYPTIPVRHKDGHVYEKEKIIEWLENHEPIPKEDPHNPGHRNPNWHNRSSPFRIGKIEEPECTVADLRYATNYFQKIVNRMRGIRQRVLSEMKPSDIRRQGLETLYGDVIGDFEAYSHAYKAKVLSEGKTGLINRDEAHALLNEHFQAEQARKQEEFQAEQNRKQEEFQAEQNRKREEFQSEMALI